MKIKQSNIKYMWNTNIFENVHELKLKYNFVHE